MAMDTTEAVQELLCIGPWSVRRLGPEGGLVFVNTETGHTQMEPPQEVLAELDLEESESECTTRSGRSGHSGITSGSATRTGGFASATMGSAGSGSRPASGSRSGGYRGGSDDAQQKEPQFRRILLGNDRGMPLAMARDILSALKEDASIFEAAEKKFSDTPAEPPMGLDGLPEELEHVAASLCPGEFSEVIGTEAGMQILLRVC